MKDGRKLLAESGRRGPHTTCFRAHSLLVSGNGTTALKWGSISTCSEDSTHGQAHSIKHGLNERAAVAVGTASSKSMLSVYLTRTAIVLWPDEIVPPFGDV